MNDLYFDYNGSTPVHPAVAEAMTSTMIECYGNAAASHPAGLQATRRIADARATIARGIGADADEVWCTSGGTESNNWALRGSADAQPGRRHLIVSSIEHWSVRRTAEWMGRNGWDVTLLPVGASGAVSVDAVREALRDDTFLVSVMLANNETGVLQPAAEIAALCRERAVRFHTDAVAALGKIPVRVDEIGCDLMSLSSHKMYAPKGCGILYVRRGTELPTLIHGCGQQEGMRSGTENTTGVVAFARAFELLESGALPSPTRLAELRDRLAEGIARHMPSCVRNGDGPFLPNTLSVSFPRLSAAELMARLGESGISVSAGAASLRSAPSHVLMAMGLGEERARSTLRFSLGGETTEASIDAVLAALRELVPTSAGA